MVIKRWPFRVQAHLHRRSRSPVGVLVEIARQRATAARGVQFDRDSTVLIGDTPNDVKAGRDGAARVIAVATGKDSMDNLADTGADTVFPDLTDTEALLAAIHGNR